MSARGQMQLCDEFISLNPKISGENRILPNFSLQSISSNSQLGRLRNKKASSTSLVHFLTMETQRISYHYSSHTMISSMFSWGSAAVDWCEANYAHSFYIAEFFNTISNLPLIVLPLLGLQLLKSYFKLVNPDAKIVFYLLFVIGISSAYFHATLSLFGQLLDELSILWILAAGFCTWFPGMNAMPGFIKSNVSLVRKASLGLAVATTILSLVQPAANSYVLMTFGPPVLSIMFGEIKRNKDPEGSKLVKLSFYAWLISVSLWLSDRLMCNSWRRLGFPYLHALWHLGIAISSYSACVLFPYLETLNRAPQLQPKIAYLPNKLHPWVPYLTLRSVDGTGKD